MGKATKTKGAFIVKQTVPILKQLGILYYEFSRKEYFLSERGEKIVALIKEGEKEKLRENFTDLIQQKSSILWVAYLLLKDNPSLPQKELGKNLAEKYDKEKDWKIEDRGKNCNSVGKSCIDILSGFGLVERKTKKIKQEVEEMEKEPYKIKEEEEEEERAKVGEENVKNKLESMDIDLAFYAKEGFDAYVKWVKEFGDKEFSRIDEQHFDDDVHRFSGITDVMIDKKSRLITIKWKKE